MQPFVDIMLQRIPLVSTDEEVEVLLGDLADQLDYRSAFLLDFPVDGSKPIKLWDSNAERSIWWRQLTQNGLTSISRSLAEVLARGGVHNAEIDPADPRYELAKRYDFATSAVVPITFDSVTRGIASFVGEPRDLTEIALPLQIVCYSLLMQARALGEREPVSDTVLTPRERQIMELSALGLTSEAVATQLGISPRTINQHIENITAKLGTKNRVHTVAEAIRRGLLA